MPVPSDPTLKFTMFGRASCAAMRGDRVRPLWLNTAGWRELKARRADGRLERATSRDGSSPVGVTPGTRSGGLPLRTRMKYPLELEGAGRRAVLRLYALGKTQAQALKGDFHMHSNRSTGEAGDAWSLPAGG